MANPLLMLLITITSIAGDQPLAPAWSPDRQVLATTKMPIDFVTPEGGNYSLFLNGALVYPRKVKHSWFSAYENWHTFLSDLAWSPDSQRVAFVEKVYDWEYSDDRNRDFDGTSSNKHFYLVIVSRSGQSTRYELGRLPPSIHLHWVQAQKLALNEQEFDLGMNPPNPVR